MAEEEAAVHRAEFEETDLARVCRDGHLPLRHRPLHPRLAIAAVGRRGLEWEVLEVRDLVTLHYRYITVTLPGVGGT